MKKEPVKIVLIGTGNVAVHLADAIAQLTHYKIEQVYNHRKTREAVALAKTLRCGFTSALPELATTADLYIIAVKDDAIPVIAKQLKPLHLQGIIVHTSGSTGLDVLKGTASHYGVFYPLQAFYKQAVINWQTTPILTEGSTSSANSALTKLGKALSQTVVKANSAQRLNIHLAAVLAINFTNALYVSAFGLIEQHLGKKHISLLKPIMRSSFEKLEQLHPKAAQTGPAKRNDVITMKKHEGLLKDDRKLQKLYKLLSDIIAEQQHGKF